MDDALVPQLIRLVVTEDEQVLILVVMDDALVPDTEEDDCDICWES